MQRGQTILEYLMIFAVVSAAMLGMQVYAKRGIQAAVKIAADQMSPVEGPEDDKGWVAQVFGMWQEFGDPKQRKQIPAGSVVDKGSTITTTGHQQRTMNEDEGGKRRVSIDEDVTQSSGTSTSVVLSKLKD